MLMIQNNSENWIMLLRGRLVWQKIFLKAQFYVRGWLNLSEEEKNSFEPTGTAASRLYYQANSKKTAIALMVFSHMSRRNFYERCYRVQKRKVFVILLIPSSIPEARRGPMGLFTGS